MWQHTFDNRKRHCWELKDGTRCLEGSSLLESPPCTTDHSADPKVVGKVEWMRFIHEVGQIMPEETNPFLSGISISQHQEVYSDPQGQARVIVYFLGDLDWRESSWRVVIEAVDRTLKPMFDQALKAVEESYK
jgi:hypothetical protein